MLIKLKFDPHFSGELESPTTKVPVGRTNHGILPYHMLYGALGSCFYATFIGVAEKMRLTFAKAEINISGEKREEAPATLKHVLIEVTIFDASHEDKIKKACEMGAKYCSIYETISRVAEMELIVKFDRS